MALIIPSWILKELNSHGESAHHNRYLLTPLGYLRAETKAERLGLDVVGVFHSHPDHLLDQPSEFDRELAMPWFSYIITSVRNGRAITSRSWLLSDDRTNFNEEPMSVEEK